jgi:hypothetical protein
VPLPQQRARQLTRERGTKSKGKNDGDQAAPRRARSTSLRELRPVRPITGKYQVPFCNRCGELTHHQKGVGVRVQFLPAQGTKSRLRNFISEGVAPSPSPDTPQRPQLRLWPCRSPQSVGRALILRFADC